MLATVLVVGTTISSSIPAIFAQSYYEQGYYEDTYTKNHKKKLADVNIQKIKCFNKNINVNGLEVTEIPPNPMMTAEAQALQEDGAANSNGLLNGDTINFDKNLVNICVNVNVNEQANIGQDIQTCDECFTQILDPEQQTELLTELRELSDDQITSFSQLCDLISQTVATGDQRNLQSTSNALELVFDNAGLLLEFDAVFDCLNEVFNGALPTPNPIPPER